MGLFFLITYTLSFRPERSVVEEPAVSVVMVVAGVKKAGSSTARFALRSG
jgi:hypothetical protein